MTAPDDRTAAWPPAALLAHGTSPVVMDAAAASVGARRRSSRLHRLHHRPGRRVTRVEVAEVERDGILEQRTLVAHAQQGRLPHGATTTEVDGVTVAVWCHPHDPYLPELPAACEPTWVAEVLRRAGWPTAGLRLRHRVYRATRAAVVEATTRGRDGSASTAYLKVLRPGRSQDLAATHAALDGTLPIPPVLAVTDGVLVLAGLPGATLRRQLRREAVLPAPATLVELTERLRHLPVGTGGDPDRRADPAPHLARLRSELPDLVGAIDTVAAATRRVGGPRGTVHGDLHPGQVLVAGGEVSGLLDLDDLGTGTLAHDAGTLVAYLAAQGDAHPSVAARAERYAADVEAAYRGLIDPDDLRAAIAGRWLALASAAHRAGRIATARRRIDRAASTLQGVSSSSARR